MAATSITWLALACMMCFITSPTSSFEIYAVDLAHRLRGISEEGLGRQKIQELFDNNAKFRMNLPNGEKTVNMLASSLGSRLNQYNEAVKAFQLVLIEHYDQLNGTTNTTATQECCMVDDTGLAYMEKFKSKVNILKPCTRYASSIDKKTITVHDEIIQTLRKNDLNNDNLAWQYYGSETGFTIVYPLGKTRACGLFDPRPRPWYAEASAPTPKDIVIAFENTGGKMAASIKQAVCILLNTTNPNDRITLIAVGNKVDTYVGSSDFSPCYSQNLALATPLNRNAFLEFVQTRVPSHGSVMNYLPALDKAYDYFEKADVGTKRNIAPVMSYHFYEGKSHGSGMNYLPALNKVHDYIKKANVGTKRSKLLVFMAASNPSDVQTSEEIMRIVRGRKNLKVVIQTYAFGDGMSNSTRNILRSMAEVTEFTTPKGTVKMGTYTAIDLNSELRVQLHSYYNIFAHSTGIDSPLVTVPYVDGWGLGLVVSLCLPVHSRGALRGVACVDAKIEDIFFNVTYYPQNSDTYVFIIDGHGRTILHPSLPKPIATQDDPVFIDITTLERHKEAADVLASMKRGGNGSKSFYTHREKNGPDDRIAPLSHYYWMKVPYTDYSLCIVFIDCDGTVEIKEGQYEKYVKYLHPNVLISQKEYLKASLCQHSGTVATTDGSVVMFSGAAYRWLTVDVNPSDESQHQLYNNFFKLRADDQGEAFKKSTQSWVSLSGLIDMIWKEDVSSRYNSLILWRHLVTASGVIRVYPGTLYSQYDPSILPWYKLTMLNPGSLIMKYAEQDDFNLIISQAIFKGSPDGHHTRRDVPVAVVAGEIKATFIYNMLEDLYPPCKEARCFIIDRSGNVLAHKFYRNTKQQASHLITMEPAIAHYLRESGQMVKTSCLDFADYRTLSSWRLKMNDFVLTSESPRFELHNVAGTNILVGITWPDTTNRATTCDCQNVRKCQYDNYDQCKCPCYETLRFNFCNNTLPTTSELDSAPTCAILKGKFDIRQPPPKNVIIKNLNPCFVTSCSKAQSSSECLEVKSCTWCHIEGQNKQACHDASLNLKCFDSITTAASTTTSSLVPVVVIFGLLIILLLIMLFLLYHYQNCCPCAPDFCCPNHTRNKNTTRNPDSGTSSALQLPRAPAPPPGNAYSLEKEEEMSSMHSSRDVLEKNNQAYIEDEEIYYEVVGDEIEQRTRKAIEEGTKRIPGQQYLHPQPPMSSLGPSKLPAYSISSEPKQKPLNVFLPPAEHTSDFDDETRNVSLGSGGSNPVVTYKILKQGASDEQIKLDPVDTTSNDLYNQFHPLPQQQLQNQENQQPQYMVQHPPPPPGPQEKVQPSTEQVYKSAVPTIPTFPHGHPYHKPMIAAKPRSASTFISHPKVQDDPSKITEIYQSEPHDLSKKVLPSNTGQLSTDLLQGHPSPLNSSRPAQNNIELSPFVGDQGPIDLANSPARPTQDQPRLASQYNRTKPPQVNLSRFSSGPLPAVPYDSNNPADPSEENMHNYYANKDALERALSDSCQDFGHSDVTVQYAENNQYDESVNYKSNNNHYAHGQEPLDYTQ